MRFVEQSGSIRAKFWFNLINNMCPLYIPSGLQVSGPQILSGLPLMPRYLQSCGHVPHRKLLLLGTAPILAQVLDISGGTCVRRNGASHERTSILTQLVPAPILLSNIISGRPCSSTWCTKHSDETESPARIKGRLQLTPGDLHQ